MTHLTMWHSVISFSQIFILIHQLFSSITAEPLRGNNILPADIPFIASIARKLPDDVKERYHFCSGALITKNLILTAAHCVENVDLKQIDVVIGATDLNDSKSKYDVQTAITFERWAALKDSRLIKLKKNDIAIIKLKRQVIQPDIVPANITSLKNTDLYGKNVTMIGWTAKQEGGLPRFMKKAHVQILSMAECEFRFELITNSYLEIPEGLLCTAAEPFTVVTRGDSGGPLLDENNNILGLNRSLCPLSSYDCSEEFADEHRFNLHTDFINEYRQFIDDVKQHFS